MYTCIFVFKKISISADNHATLCVKYYVVRFDPKMGKFSILGAIGKFYLDQRKSKLSELF